VTRNEVEPPPIGRRLPDPGEIHLWCLPSDPDVRAEYLSVGADILSAAERKRHSGMTHPGAASHFLAGRIVARRVLGEYLSQDPAEIHLSVDSAGKPYLNSAVAQLPAFSLSHAGGETILVIAGEGEIGVDIEALSRAPAALRIAHEFYSPEECRFLERQHGAAASGALTLWTLKESIVKAQARTVWDGLKGVSLTIDGGDIAWEPPPSDRNRWRLATAPFRNSYMLAIAHRVSRRDSATISVIQYDVSGETVSGTRFDPTFSG